MAFLVKLHLNYDIHHNKFSYFGAYNPYTPWTY